MLLRDIKLKQKKYSDEEKITLVQDYIRYTDSFCNSFISFHPYNSYQYQKILRDFINVRTCV